MNAGRISESDTIRAVFARNLRRLMAADDIPQKDLADKMGVSAPTVSAWVSGRKLPRPETIDALAELFDVDRSDLYDVPSKKIDWKYTIEKGTSSPITVEDIEMAQKIARLDTYRKNLIVAILETDPPE